MPEEYTGPLTLVAMNSFSPMNTPHSAVRAVIGKSILGGFFGLSDGDMFADLSGKTFRLVRFNGGWGLKGEDGAMHPEFGGEDYMGFIWTFNQLSKS